MIIWECFAKQMTTILTTESGDLLLSAKKSSNVIIESECDIE